MNTLKDTLIDFATDIKNNCDQIDGCRNCDITDEKLEPFLEEYIERIKNELNVEKYLK